MQRKDIKTLSILTGSPFGLAAAVLRSWLGSAAKPEAAVMKKNVLKPNESGLLCCLVPVFLIFSLPLEAAPDPDIFDGRVAAQQGGGGDPSSGSGDATEASDQGGQSEAEAGSPSESGDAQPSADSRSSERDFDEIGRVGGGQSVSTSDTKSREPGSLPSDREKNGGSSPGDPSAATGGSGDSRGSGGEPRDFSEIGGISSGGSQGVDVNSSKAASSSLPTGGSGTSSSQTNQGQGTGSGGSQTSTGSGSGDLGETLPSGI